MGVHLANILSDILEPFANVLGLQYEFVSTEDMLGRMDRHNAEVEAIKDFYERKIGKEIESPGDLMVMLAADCVAMFPSMRKGNTSKIVADMILSSDIEVGEFCWQEASRYIKLTCHPSEIQSAGLTSWMPTRRHRKGPRPGLNSRDVHSKEIGADSQWIFPNETPPKSVVRKLLAKVVEVGVKTSFDQHIYTFGGRIFQQVEGGPIGSRLTMVCARH